MKTHGASVALPVVFLSAWLSVIIDGLRARPTALPNTAPPADQLPLRPDMPCSGAVGSDVYKLPLSDQQEKRAMAVYRRSIVITAHDHCYHPDDFRDQEQAGITIRTIKLTTDGIYWQGARRYAIENRIEGWKSRGRLALQLLQEQIAASKGKVILVRNVADIHRVKRQGKLGVIASFEGGRPLEGRLENLREFYSVGLRDMQTFWAVPSPLKTPENTPTEFGLAVIEGMNRLGIVVDLSHHTAAAFSKAISAAKRPVIISHGAMNAVSRAGMRGGTDHLDDNTLRAIASNGGVLCLHFYQGYIRPAPGKVRSTVDDLVSHMEHVKKVVGIDHVALGVDFFPEKGQTPWVQGLEKMQEMPNVARAMVQHGFSDEEIEKVLGGNLMRVYGQVWKR